MNTGIDYGLGKTNIDQETGLRYGVISQNSLTGEALDEIYTNGRDLNWESFVEEFKANALAMASEHMSERDAKRFADYAADWDDLGEACQCDGEVCPHYEESGYVITKCLDSDLIVTKSPYKTQAQFCSPCVPGACNLDSPMSDGAWCYCLGHDWFDDSKAPYPVFAVDSGKEIKADEAI